MKNPLGEALYQANLQVRAGLAPADTNPRVRNK